MPRMRFFALLIILVLLPSMVSCRLFRRSEPVKPPVTATPAASVPPAQQEPAPSPQEEPPKPEEPAASTAPEPVKKRPSPAGPRVQSPPAAAPQAQAPAPQLRPMLSPEQRQQLDRTVTARLQRSRQAMAVLKTRQLSKEQANVLSQVSTFVQQAEEARSTDLARASNLAERADVLSQDLLNSAR